MYGKVAGYSQFCLDHKKKIYTALLFYQKNNYHKEAQWLQIQCILKVYLGRQKVSQDLF